MTDKEAIDILSNALISVFNCEGVARRGAAAEGGGQDCSEFDRARDAFAYLQARGIDVNAAWRRGDMIDYSTDPAAGAGHSTNLGDETMKRFDAIFLPTDGKGYISRVVTALDFDDARRQAVEFAAKRGHEFIEVRNYRTTS